MGYTVGRRLTFDFMKEQALKYKTRVEFQQKDPSCYTTARLRGVLNLVCAHMKPCKFSVPQRICLLILDKLLNRNGDYSTRRVIPPLELDIYYGDYKLAFEYCGRGWHSTNESMERDRKKVEVCKQKGIHLIVINERSRRYEEDIKEQIIENLNIINEVTKLKITPQDVFKTTVCYHKVFDMKDFDINQIVKEINKCKTIKEFVKNHNRSYILLSRFGMGHLLDGLRTRTIQSKQQILDECKKITDYSDFVMNHASLYQKCYKRGILKEASAHMKRKKIINATIEEILEIAKNFVTVTSFKNKHTSYYYRLKEAGLIKQAFPVSYRGKRLLKITDEMIVEAAKKFGRRTEFKRRSFALYKEAKARGLLDTLLPKKAKHVHRL